MPRKALMGQGDKLLNVIAGMLIVDINSVIFQIIHRRKDIVGRIHILFHRSRNIIYLKGKLA